DAEGLPGSFRMRLRRALAHYGITDLEPSLDLGPALYRIFLAHRRAAAHVPVVSELLQWRLWHPRPLFRGVRGGPSRAGGEAGPGRCAGGVRRRGPGPPRAGIPPPSAPLAAPARRAAQ